MRVQFLNVGATYEELKPEIDRAIKNVLNNGKFINGEQVRKFEQEFANYCGTKYCIGVGNGLNALELLLRAFRIGEGDEVIVPANTFIATILAISNIGAIPVLVDPDVLTYNIDPQKIEPAFTKKTKSVIPVHLYGQTANIRDIKSICNKYKSILVEDAAQAHGAKHYGKKSGSLGDGAGFSFYPGKNLGAYGDGGAITTSDKKIADYVSTLRDYGSRKKYVHLYKGTNSRLDEIQAAILRVKLKHLDEWNQRRRIIADLYLKHLNPQKNGMFQNPVEDQGNKHVWHLFVIRTKKRTNFVDYLNQLGIGTLVHYPIPPYAQKAYSELNSLRSNYPVTNLLAAQVVSLPIGPHLTQIEVEYVIEKVNKFISKHL